MNKIFLIPLLLICCALYVPPKYQYDSEIKEDHGGHFKSGSDIPFVVLEKTVMLDSVYFSDSLFDKNSTAPYQIGEIAQYFQKGKEQYLFMYRNYIGSCCDSKDVGTIVFLINIVGNTFNPIKSVIMETGPWQLPHLVYWPNKISTINTDALRIFASREGKEYVFSGMYNIDKKWTIDKYMKSKEMLRSKL